MRDSAEQLRGRHQREMRQMNVTAIAGLASCNAFLWLATLTGRAIRKTSQSLQACLGSGKNSSTQRKVVRNGGQAVSAMLMVGLSGQYYGIFLEYLEI